jgi:hypothetical protein
MPVTWIDASVLSRIGGSGIAVRRISIPDGDLDCLQADSLPGLIQALGYLKYRLDGNTFLRGQSSLHEGRLEASLMRGAGRRQNRDTRIEHFINQVAPWPCDHAGLPHRSVSCPGTIGRDAGKSSLLGSGVPRYAAEPLLQHYGIRTRWLDVVDNLWIALWFACHEFTVEGRYLHVVRRTVHDAGEGFAYILSITLTAPVVSEERRGLWWFRDLGRVVDLRVAVPSYYVRPHAQHGYLIRPQAMDGSGLKVAVVRIPLLRALEWLGSSVILSPFGIYPPATVDDGYRQLLDRFRHEDSHDLGTISVVGPGY